MTTLWRHMIQREIKIKKAILYLPNKQHLGKDKRRRLLNKHKLFKKKYMDWINRQTGILILPKKTETIQQKIKNNKKKKNQSNNEGWQLDC
ncbi:MAG: hypothetical protein CO029_05060 [Candidatus Magasanikbacteria bacterium CG_4_9_14_0_2_um_filter_41_10]|uniref:Uncharacterized protein n=1 Tax=Candidatus Magasanikbacteria bacterium CG_4_10_14_0_2_um_filter_41_31 TaxID=1974639 RepID=A0A2M7V3M6_9BACT|nr:MAG: hypothetical protein COX83_02735 [Candidatus Magasanikbacteria bacterium CG_4_10_14_0_2_um_filter_41_31]PJC53003.1 MAG: hypothetical protein CO029_05060 [Candidatus Magasanikbacteria bacterium CG_4_9_14_0_2_um_filter_41_10]